MILEPPATNCVDATAGLSRLRTGLLILAQTGRSDLSALRLELRQISQNAADQGRTDICARATKCDDLISQFGDGPDPDDRSIYQVLDQIARIESDLFDAPFRSEDFVSGVSDLLELSLVEKDDADKSPAMFEIDEDTYDIFRAEAVELLNLIDERLALLGRDHADQASIWEVRRAAHTFKGSAGIVGLESATKVAHKMEDVLDNVVEGKRSIDKDLLIFLSSATRDLDNIVHARPRGSTDEIDELYFRLLRQTDRDDIQGRRSNVGGPLLDAAFPRQYSTPVVRASLDRLNELLVLSHQLIRNHVDLSLALTDNRLDRSVDLIAAAEKLSRNLQSKLLEIRMVRFGTLETRLGRTVQSTCTDQSKKAAVIVENGNAEVDTLVIDVLIEPLLHILKNAVVHGIELPETRRLIGKPEQGSIKVRIEADNEALVLSVSDDGAGISTSNIKEAAIARGVIDRGTGSMMNNRDALKLIFEKGLTTAEKIDLSAGRGIGMSIAKEAIEARGGSLLIESQPLVGTTFTILLPLNASGLLPDKSTTEDPQSNVIRSGPPLVLVIDDSRTVREYTSGLVESAGCRTISAGNGAEALELLLSGAFDPNLILSDVEMPQINGWELLEYTKTDENLGHIPVVLVTSLDSASHRQRAAELGATDYIVKPLRESSIFDLLKKLGLRSESMV